MPKVHHAWISAGLKLTRKSLLLSICPSGEIKSDVDHKYSNMTFQIYIIGQNIDATCSVWKSRQMKKTIRGISQNVKIYVPKEL